MNKAQATIIITLLAVVLVLLAGRSAAVELLGNLSWVLVAVLLVAAVVFPIRAGILHLWATRRATELKNLDHEIDRLFREIAAYPGPRLTGEAIPQRFPSKEAAQAFGEKWSRGGPESFSAKAVDAEGRYEDLPNFDRTSISSGMLFPYPALFFGMREAHREDDAWYLDFRLAKKRWLTAYRDHLRNRERS
jgi:hypothetical protein